MTTFDLGRSECLHQRVRSFVDATSRAQRPADDFDTLALELAAHQLASGTCLNRLLTAQGQSIASLTRAAQLPAVPTDVFKLVRVACHPQHLDEVVFLTSGTTLGTRGRHALRTTATYQYAARAWGRHMLLPDAPALHWILLASPFGDARESSLGFMLDDFADAFGNSVVWGVRDEVIDLHVVISAIERTAESPLPCIVAGTSFAFVHLLDALAGRSLPLGSGGRVMQTGGFKGRAREVDGSALRSQIARAFQVPESYIVAEYGMTELGSQAYEGCLRREMGFGSHATPPGVLVAPPWMRVRAVDPISLTPVPDGNVGIARIEDLTNVDSAVAVQTADQIVTGENGFRLLGRVPGSTPRGCSIGVDEVLGRREG